jgi:hypothetical protein
MCRSVHATQATTATEAPALHADAQTSMPNLLLIAQLMEIFIARNVFATQATMVMARRAPLARTAL